MAVLISAHRLQKTFGSRQLFKSLSFSVDEKDRIGLIGPNGAGKSTLLKLLARLDTADDGQLSFARGLRVAYLPQTPQFPEGQTVYEALTAHADDPYDADFLARVDTWLSRLELVSEDQALSLSGGWQKRLALAQALVLEPQVLLLDEPTNHLDVTSILWLEEFLASSPMAVVTVTHDRLFLQRVANRIFDLNSRYPDGFLNIQGTYADYLEARDLQLQAQERHEEVMRNQLTRETEWLRRGAQARQTKQKARIERAEDLKIKTEEVAARNRERQAQIDFQEMDRRPKKLIELQGVSKGYGGRRLFQDLDLLVTPKTRIALLGANGCGKSTLIRILCGQEKPEAGTVFHNEALQIAYFEQHRQGLDLEQTVLRAVCPDGDYVDFQGAKIFARSYLSRFLFRTEQMDMPLRKLSGGEQSRLRIAQLMLRPAHVLILDEPTNDLDAATLDVLADTLRDYNGAVILVTHDRYFLDQVSDDVLAFPLRADDSPKLLRFAGYQQWEDWAAQQKTAVSASKAKETSSAAPKRKVSFKEKHEWENIEAKILTLEGQLGAKQKEAEANASSPAELTKLYGEIGKLQAELDTLYARWAELESLFKP